MTGRIIEKQERIPFWEQLKERAHERGCPIPASATLHEGKPDERQLEIRTNLRAVVYIFELYREDRVTKPIVRIGIYDWANRPRNHDLFRRFERHKDAINESFGGDLEWRDVGDRPNHLGAEIIYRANAENLWDGRWL